MAELFERHEVRVRGKDSTIVFSANSTDGKLVIRQELDGKRPKDSCAITLSDPEELRGFFKGLRRIMASLGTIESPGVRVCHRKRPLRAAGLTMSAKKSSQRRGPGTPSLRALDEGRRAGGCPAL